MWRQSWIVVAAGLFVVPGLAAAQDVAAGKKVFNKCTPCHNIGPGAKNKVGPQLDGLFGRKAGTATAFNYSDAMKNAGWVWDEATFKEYITDPKKKVPGNKMLFPGLKDEQEREDIAAYIGSFNADGSPK